MKTPADITSFLRTRVELFAGFSEEHLVKLVASSRVVSFEPNEAVVHAGEEAKHFGVVLAGTVTTPVGRLEAGSTFGELALMTGEPMVVELIAATRCELLLIPVAVFQAFIVAEPQAVQQISRTISDRFKSVLADPAKRAALRPSDDPLELKGERPEKILVVNCGSSSLKYRYYDTADEGKNKHGQVERIGIDTTFPEAFAAMIKALGDASEVSVVAHRVVHGGEKFTEATLIDDDVLRELEKLSSLAPLHNPVNLAGIREMRKLLPGVPHVAVFDTGFHHTLPSYAYLYGLPYEFYEKKAVRRYGFHGMSHSYVTLRAAQFLGKRPNELEIVSCHLGNGSSLCAVDHGRSIDTTMGFTPVEGLIMGTRCGDVDAGAITFLEREGEEIDELINKKSGLLGLSGVSSDMREILKAAEVDNARALIALKAYCYRVRKYIGAYVAAMGGVDAIVFTGGVGQGSAMVRALALQGLDRMGIALDEQRNRDARGFEETCRVSSDDSKIAVLVVPTDEERMMARETLRALSRSYITRVLETQRQKPILVEVSAHHVHLTQEHVEALFGKGHQLTPRADLSQPGHFACEEQVTLVGPKGRIERVRVLGPCRRYSQVEIAMTEQFKLGVHPPIRESGDIKDTPGCTLEGTAGSVKLDRGVICAWRHIHMTPEDALRYGVRDKSVVRVRVAGDRELEFGDVLVRVSPSFRLAMHIDTDEANAANVQTGAQGFIKGLQSDG